MAKNDKRGSAPPVPGKPRRLPPWPQVQSVLGRVAEAYLADTIERYVERGNHDAGRRVLGVIISCLRRGEALPPTLSAWLADKLDGAISDPTQVAGDLFVVAPRSGRGAQAANADDLSAAERLANLQWQAAATAYRLIRVDGWKTEAAFSEVADRLHVTGERPYKSGTIKGWYHKRLTELQEAATRDDGLEVIPVDVGPHRHN